MLTVIYNEITSWPIWLALIPFLVAYISGYIAIYGASFGGILSLFGFMACFAPSAPLTTRQKWIAWLVGIFAGLCAVVKFGIDIGIWFGWLPEKL